MSYIKHTDITIIPEYIKSISYMFYRKHWRCLSFLFSSKCLVGKWLWGSHEAFFDSGSLSLKKSGSNVVGRRERKKHTERETKRDPSY